MRSERIRQLEKFYQDDPGDPFNSYALALEYLSTSPEKTRELFELLLTRHPDYLPTYYAAATFFADVEEWERATQVFERGIELAQKVGDAKTLRELRSAYENGE